MYQHSTEALSIVCSGQECDIDREEVYGDDEELQGRELPGLVVILSAVESDEQMVREYIRHQEKEDEHYDQLKLGI